MRIRILPQEITTQIVWLLILSAVIFHLCISAAFLIGRGYFFPPGSNTEILSIERITDFMKIANKLPGAEREQMLAWLKDQNPLLDVKTETSPGPASPLFQNDPSIEAIQSRAGADIKVDGIEASGQLERIGFQFKDGAYVTIALPPGPRQPGLDAVRPPAKGAPPGLLPPIFATLLFFAINFTILLFWAARALTRPLRRFAEAVDAFSVDGTMTLPEESGPRELRGAERALNRMRERVKMMLEQRTAMLAAISHDLRTPVTRLRLRAEFIESSDIREPILRDIEQMNAMVHSALSFIRDGVEVQRDGLLDLGALLQTICDEFADMGYEIRFEAEAALSIKGNVDELYRAVTNLVSNAVKFGTKVAVHLRRAGQDCAEIDVIDNGPGIAEDRKSAMLAPFTRGDEMRKADGLQGFGLGLPIVQTIVTAHRGFLHLLNREPDGFIARMTLPIG